MKAFYFLTKRRPPVMHSRVTALDDKLRNLANMHTFLAYPRLACVCLYWSKIKNITYPPKTWCPDQLSPNLVISSEVICMFPSIVYMALLLKKITHKDSKETQNSDKIHIFTWIYLLISIVV